MSGDADETFRYLESNEVGTQFAILYHSWATALEERRNWAAADRAFSLGIHRCDYSLRSLGVSHFFLLNYVYWS